MPKMILTRARVLLVFCVLCVLGATLYVARDMWMGPSQVAIVPHEALYQVRLSKLHQTNTLAAASGQMSYRLADACDGWNVAQKFNLVFVYTESPSALISSDYNTFESKDGRRYQFSTRRTRDGQVTDEILGRAERRDPLGNGVVIYQKPKEAEVPLAANILFPTQHTLELLRAALAGKQWISKPIFDGSDLAISTDVNSFIKKLNKPYLAKVKEIVPIVEGVEDPEAPVLAEEPAELLSHATPMTAEEMNESPLIKGTRAWRLRMAFYSGPEAAAMKDSEEQGEEDAAQEEEMTLVPDYEMTMVIHSNGLVSQFTLDYSDFSLEARLLSLAEVVGNSC
ncbi:MAG TPA: DUF1849 family protein [Alphaproteobacteria bacterium]|nr:hypothetical protein [Rhodospirillaceae bacterium]HRJ12402.1 DUF1849 family protein [Alphaproteobacteria bacterium]